ncbi:hypothetical protein B0H11DRAFT_2192938 [Mycena galericulata]|nr:hypothetical protein B0H11DRAFT_2192938 [Mycena galericulata]
MMVEGEDGEEGVVEEGKKHVCSTCGKRFNRPSSLRIHVNTHTGATPFRCPHPSCGRAFNVNSNMRRHFRNHANPDFAESASMHSYPSPSSASSPISPTSGPPSATWSVSSADSGSLSPLTPSSSPSSSAAYTYSYSPTPPEPKPQPAAYSAPRLWTPPPTSLSLSPVSTWSSVPASAASTKQRYSESDVRSERR